MNKYVILANPGHNRIYFDTAFRIAKSEIQALSNAYEMEIYNIEHGDIDGLPSSICFESGKELSQKQFSILGFSSIYYAIFEIIEGNLLKPVKVKDFHTFPESMVQILKYNGKTNEQFTRLMVNLALSACNTNSDKITLLDPMCGKGTTLYEGFIRGYDVKGIEINEQWATEIQAYVLRFLKEGKYKHKAQKSKISDSKGRKISGVFNLNAAKEKTHYNSGNVQNFQLLSADTRKADLIIKKKSCDIIVSDLPYGVQHASKNDKNTERFRSPIELLKEASPSWYNVLKANGSVVLAYNEFTMKRAEAVDALENAGFTVLNDELYNHLLHRVDASINRNVIVAVRLN